MLSRARWYVRFLGAVLFIAAAWIVLERLEQKINPVGWDLETLQKIHEMEQITSQHADQ